MFGAIVASATIESPSTAAAFPGVLIARRAPLVCKMVRIKAAARRAKRPFRGVQRPFSADFCAAIAAISRVQRGFGAQRHM
jgi:hypothetical protein